jgi:hypothetical protein
MKPVHKFAIGDRNKTHRTPVNLVLLRVRRFGLRSISPSCQRSPAGFILEIDMSERLFMGEVVGAVVLLLARTTARLASACGPVLRGAAEAVLAASQVPPRGRTQD